MKKHKLGKGSKSILIGTLFIFVILAGVAIANFVFSIQGNSVLSAIFSSIFLGVGICYIAALVAITAFGIILSIEEEGEEDGEGDGDGSKQ